MDSDFVSADRLMRALSNGEFEPYLQPVVSASDLLCPVQSFWFAGTCLQAKSFRRHISLTGWSLPVCCCL